MFIWVSSDRYEPNKLGNSVSASRNNRFITSCAVAESDNYIFYINYTDNNRLVRVDKSSGEKIILKKDIGDSDAGCLFVYKEFIVYMKSKGKGYDPGYCDIYSCDFNGKKEKLIKKECPLPYMTVDQWVYFPEKDLSISRVSLEGTKERKVTNEKCNKFVGVSEKNKEVLFYNDYSNLLKLKINNRRINAFAKTDYKLIDNNKWSRSVKEVNDVIGIENDCIWFLGDNGHSLCNAKKSDGKWKTKVIIGKDQGISFLLNSALEKDKVYYMNSDETTVCMYDINTGKSSEIYKTTNKNIKILAAIGDNILISEWKKDDGRVNYYDAVDDKSARHYYINNSGKVLYELD